MANLSNSRIWLVVSGNKSDAMDIAPGTLRCNGITNKEEVSNERKRQNYRVKRFWIMEARILD